MSGRFLPNGSSGLLLVASLTACISSPNEGRQLIAGSLYTLDVEDISEQDVEVLDSGAKVSLATQELDRSWKNDWIYVPGSRYVIPPRGMLEIFKRGWHVHCPWVDHERLADGDMTPIDNEGAFISAIQPEVWFIGKRTVSRQAPAPDELAESVIAISKGDGRLILLDLAGQHDIGVVTTF